MTSMKKPRAMTNSPSLRRQSGVALLVSLVLLVAVTLLGVSAMQGTILQERMSANQRDVEEAFNAAEYALRRGEQELLGSPGTYILQAPLGRPRNMEINDTDVQVAASGDAFMTEPGYHITYRGDICPDGDAAGECDDLFAITALGLGRTDTTRVVLQTIFRMRQ